MIQINSPNRAIELSWPERVSLDLACGDVRGLLLGLNIITAEAGIHQKGGCPHAACAAILFNDHFNADKCLFWHMHPNPLNLPLATFERLWENVSCGSIKMLPDLKPAEVFSNMLKVDPYRRRAFIIALHKKPERAYPPDLCP
jgi:hypothetical protein